jgi:hypothetical protein
LVSSSLSPWRHELQVILRMRRLSVLRLEADMRHAEGGVVGVGILMSLWFMGGSASCSSS